MKTNVCKSDAAHGDGGCSSAVGTDSCSGETEDNSLYCFEDPTKVSLMNTYADEDRQNIVLYATWCGLAVEPSPTCVTKEIADLYKDKHLQFI